MTAQPLKIEIKVNYPLFLGLVLLAHLLMMTLAGTPFTNLKQEVTRVTRSPLKILTIGEDNAKSHNSVFLEPTKAAAPTLAKKAAPKNLSLRDLMAAPASAKAASAQAPSARPGTLPKRTTALSGLRYGADDFKKMAQDPMLQGGAEILNSQRMALNFEVPEGKKADELNESQLKLYGFLRRGAMKYVSSLASELKEFELKNPHMHFPMTDTKQVMTGRLIFDSQGNLKQIKMVRWTNVDKLQGFFENVLKRLDNLQNPPKELWAEEGEFTIYVTLQVNG